MCLSHTYWTDQQKSLFSNGYSLDKATGVTAGRSQRLKHAFMIKIRKLAMLVTLRDTSLLQ